ncbi:PAP/25A associated domain family [Aspergillus mulundensis]|uniref:polynucleotide adenylyltransferase n=1 Tax=Aspergillus mulundensis TaxID=1810919 RepID=A0A3D8RJU0_9EURO|nr:hypothetical protein DSM5745_06971 [Aspergillus mulundensis]RDW74309.1 hypothetical protein DSM5745_06971 [Aspergillus mulundensis]
MPWSPSKEESSETPNRPALTSQQSNSLPSTPYQHARKISFHSRSPSPRHGSTSPRSTHSESTHIPPSARKPFKGCKYETAMSFFRRRMPYSIGADVLPEEKEGLKQRLRPEEERKLTADMLEVYDRLLPSAESDSRRRRLVRKLEDLFNRQWPGCDIKVHVFGSSGNKLCSSDSDVDICITTTCKDLEHVCLLADVLAKNGMERVVCISHAKVPIVKIWDPELRLACDMNVNNTMALENTRMVRTYVEIDERVRPLAMIVKHWTKRRILNDAGLGGTLSSYTWICLIINFLQTREPPILPSLQARPHKKRLTADGLVCSFDDDLDSLMGYGKQNKQSLGELFFQFFRYYGHELDYEKYVVSVREGKLISKEGKGWHLLQNNRLCVEEPFNTIRNLGNTADDTSFRGVHMELRRAFKALSDGNFEQCCEQYEYPPEAERSWERPPPQPRPIVTTAPPPSRGGRGGGRGGRHSNQYNRGGHSGGRRSSNTGNKNHFRQTNGGISASELSLHAQHAQYLLHDHLYQQIQILQAQEQELRLQLQSQALITGRPPPVLIRQPFIQFPVPAQETSADDGSRSRSGSRSGAVNHSPNGVPSRQNVYYNSAYLPVAVPGGPGSNTNPPSPAGAIAMPDLRRNPRRSSVANGSPGGSLRAHSQPARPVNSLPNFAPLYSMAQHAEGSQSSNQRNPSGASDDSLSEEDGTPIPNSLPNRPLFLDEARANEYMAYYFGSSPQLHAYHQNAMLSPLSASLGLAMPNGSVIPFVGNAQDYMSAASGAEAYGQAFDNGSVTSPKSGQSQQRKGSRTAASSDRGGPLIVDGSVPPSEQRVSIPTDHYDHYGLMAHCPSNSDDQNTDTPASVSDSFSQDFQDSSSVEIDPTPFYGHQGIDSHAMGNPADVFVNGHVNGHSAKPSLLSSRLQGLHLSNGEKTEHSSKPAQDKTKATSAYHEAAEREPLRHKINHAVDKGLSTSSFPHATESNMASPNGKRRHHGADAPEKNNGATHKGKPRNLTLSTGLNDQKERAVGGPRKTGSTCQDSNYTHASSGWQTTKRKNKKNNKFSSDHRHGPHNGAEPLPVDESMRKGG